MSRQTRSTPTRVIAAPLLIMAAFFALAALAQASSAPSTTFTTAPAAPDGTNGWFLSDPVITLTSDMAGPTYYQWGSTSDIGWQSYAAPFASGSPDGQYTLYYRSVDSTGDATEDAKSALIKLDVTPPSAPSTADSASHSSTPLSDPTIDVTWDADATDATSGIDGYSFSFSAGATEEPDAVKDAEEDATSDASAPLGSGEWYFNLIALDNAGNTSDAIHAGPFSIDVDAPTTTLTISPASPNGSNGWYVDAPDITLDSTEAGVSQYQWDGTDDTGWSSGATLEAIVGEHSLYYRSIDEVGNTEDSQSMDVKVDMASPLVAFRSTAPRSGAYLRGTVKFPIRAIDAPSGIDVVRMRFGSIIKGSDGVWPYAPSVNTRNMANGRHTLTASAFDNAGNSPGEVSRTFNIDNTKPVTKGRSASVKKGGKVRLYYRVTDRYSPTATVVLKIMSKKGKTLKSVKLGSKETGKTYSYRYTARLKKGAYYYGVKATDRAGNVSATSRSRLRIK